jgi:hypothetical protein
MKHIRSTIALPLLLTTLVGCGKSIANQGAVQGHVTLDAKPIEQGSILFTPIKETRGMVVGGQISNGEYRLPAAKGPAVGWNRVEIRSGRKTGRTIPKGFGATGEMMEELAEAVAKRFNSESTLTVEINPGDNTADFRVTSQ